MVEAAPPDSIEDQLNDLRETVIFWRWLFAVFFGLVILAGVSGTLILWHVSQSVAAVQESVATTHDVEQLRSLIADDTHEIDGIKTSSISRIEIEGIGNRLDAMSSTIRTLAHRVDQLEARSGTNGEK